MHKPIADQMDAIVAIEIMEEQILRSKGSTILRFTSLTKPNLSHYGTTTQTQYEAFKSHINQLCIIHFGIYIILYSF